jgi:hypothetical protein
MLKLQGFIIRSLFLATNKVLCTYSRIICNKGDRDSIDHSGATNFRVMRISH